VRTGAAQAVGHREQVQVVVAQQALHRAFQRAQPAQCRQAFGAAVHEITEHHDGVARRRKIELLKKPLERIAATLQVANQVVHGGKMSKWGTEARTSILLPSPPLARHATDGCCPAGFPDRAEALRSRCRKRRSRRHARCGCTCWFSIGVCSGIVREFAPERRTARMNKEQ